jgi:hypothetical protein
MAGSFADYAENIVLDHVFGKTTFTAGANLYVGLSTTTITDAGGNITEPSGGAYARVTIANNKTTWTTASGGSISNAITITFASATSAWGTVTDMFISDSSSAGNIYVYDDLTTSKAVTSGDTVQFNPGDLTINLG